MTFANHFFRGLGLAALIIGLASPVSAQNATNWHVMSNGLDVVYGGIGAGGSQVPTVDGIGNWIDGEDLRGSHYISAIGMFGYRQNRFQTSECVLGAPPAVSLNFPAIVFVEYDGRNANRQDIFHRPACGDGSGPNINAVTGEPTAFGTTTAGFLPFGLSSGASANFLLSTLPTIAGLPTSTVVLIPNNGLVPSSNGGTATLIAAASGSLPIASTGLCWVVTFTWIPTALQSFDHIDGWWYWQSNSANGNQYWAMSNDELNSYTNNTIVLDGGGTALIAFFATADVEWHSLTRDPSNNQVLAPVGHNGTGIYYATTSFASPVNPNGGGDVGRHGGVSVSGLGGTLNPITGLGTQDPAGSPTPGNTPTFGFMTWDNELLSGTTGGLRTYWAQLDWQGVFGLNPDTVPDALFSATERVPIGVANPPGAGPWPQPVTKGLFAGVPGFLHDTSVAKGDPDPLGFAAGTFGIGGNWAATQQLPIAGLSPVCTIGLPAVIDYGNVGVNATKTAFQVDPAKARISPGGSVTVID